MEKELNEKKTGVDLTNDDLKKVVGGSAGNRCPFCGINLSTFSPVFQTQHKMLCRLKKN